MTRIGTKTISFQSIQQRKKDLQDVISRVKNNKKFHILSGVPLYLQPPKEKEVIGFDDARNMPIYLKVEEK